MEVSTNMDATHMFDLPPELIVRILRDLDEQSLGRLKPVCRYINSLIQRHRTTLARQMIYMAVFKEGELTVERYLRKSRWEDYKYPLPGPYVDEKTFRQLACADIDTIRFQMHVPDDVAREWAEHLVDLKSTTFRVVFSRCHMSVEAMITLLTALRPQQVAIEFGADSRGISVEKLCEHAAFREISHLNLINSRVTDDDLRLLDAQYLTVYETSRLTLAGLRQILLDWYNGKRTIKDYHLSVSERIVPDRLFDGLPTRRRSVIAWEVRSPDTVLHVSIIGPGVSIVKVFDVISTC
ncbi:hypothetical protein Y032_0042g708 [Ancylostoma ceylanicum]|uniref:F-box domain-containing protein n=1 Tax=Ancylostoma ceylanicum TaxID=53326 RepID=A0A016UGR5_9BILA|nr:hypothetical protein Y032_0042g708 [Ancylostoma ceylanicum]